MCAQAAKTEKTVSAQGAQGEHRSPLDGLAALFHDDMKNVNAAIMAKMQSDVALIPTLASYLIASGGKRVRPLLTLACSRLYGDTGARPFGLAAAVEFIHTATLLHDDVVDESAQRRGKDSANIIFGNQASVLVGDFLFSRAFQLMTADGSIDVLRILSQASAVIAEGEVMQLGTTGNLATTMDEYLKVVGAKTAALFAAACEIGPVIANAGSDAADAMRNYGDNLGIAFQIADDVLDYGADEARLGKTVGDDFREGKMTAPVLIALSDANKDERAFWQRTIADKIQTEEDLRIAQDILNKHDALARGIDLARGYAHKARAALSAAPQGEIRNLLHDLADFVVNRGH